VLVLLLLLLLLLPLRLLLLPSSSQRVEGPGGSIDRSTTPGIRQLG
jgi:hypothetical protein